MIDWSAPDYLPVIEERRRRLDLIRSDPRLLTAARKRYATPGGAADFIDDWVWTYDPRRLERGGSASIPMILWPKQREYIAWLEERMTTGSSGIVEKSRDAGATYLSLAYALCLWLFRGAVKVGFGSRKAMLVDRIGDPDALFEKLRMMLRLIPRELLPAGFEEDKHATYMRLLNPETGATITGEAGDEIGRGGRSTIYFIDEAAKLMHPERIDAALSQNTNVRIDISTANGDGNPFYRKRHSGQFPVFTFHWRDDPRKDDAWYAEQKRILDPVIVASEIDIDYHASVENICIPAVWVRAAVGLKLPEAGERRGGLDVADEGGDLNAFVSGVGVVVKYIETWAEGTTTQTARKAAWLAREQHLDALNFDGIGVGAGVRGEWRELERTDRKLCRANAINVGSKDLKGEFEPGRRNADLFENLRALLWWSMRRRFMRTYEHVNGIREWPVEDLIALPTPDECPKVADLISELSRPKAGFNGAGKIQIESKSDMKARSVPSPNVADALMLMFAPRENPLRGIAFI